jgi:antitoxin component of MazEF toxin-antitoxin module
MRVKVRQVGNSLTITIPKEIAVELGMNADMEVDLTVKAGSLVVEPAQTRWERLLWEVRRQAIERGLQEDDVDQAIAESRGRRT